MDLDDATLSVEERSARYACLAVPSSPPLPAYWKTKAGRPRTWGMRGRHSRRAARERRLAELEKMDKDVQATTAASEAAHADAAADAKPAAETTEPAAATTTAAAQDEVRCHARQLVRSI